MPDSAETQLAVRAALEKCYASDDPVNCLAEELGKLTLGRSWSVAEKEQVKQEAMRIFTGLLLPSNRQAADQHSLGKSPEIARQTSTTAVGAESSGGV